MASKDEELADAHKALRAQEAQAAGGARRMERQAEQLVSLVTVSPCLSLIHI